MSFLTAIFAPSAPRSAEQIRKDYLDTYSGDVPAIYRSSTREPEETCYSGEDFSDDDKKIIRSARQARDERDEKMARDLLRDELKERELFDCNPAEWKEKYGRCTCTIL